VILIEITYFEVSVLFPDCLSERKLSLLSQEDVCDCFLQVTKITNLRLT